MLIRVEGEARVRIERDADFAISAIQQLTENIRKA